MYYLVQLEITSNKMTEFIGRWKLRDTDEYFEDYLKQIGIGYASRKIGAYVTTYEEIEQTDEDTWTLCVTASVRKTRIVFKLGQEFHETTMDGREVLAVFRVVDGALVKEEKHMKGGYPNTRITRQRIDENTIKTTFEAVDRGVKAIRIYTRNGKK